MKVFRRPFLSANAPPLFRPKLSGEECALAWGTGGEAPRLLLAFDLAERLKDPPCPKPKNRLFY